MAQIGKKILLKKKELMDFSFLLYRPYDRHLSAPAADPYYSGGLPQGPPPTVDPYQSYDPYQKYYASRPRDPEFPDQRLLFILYFSQKNEFFLFV